MKKIIKLLCWAFVIFVIIGAFMPNGGGAEEPLIFETHVYHDLLEDPYDLPVFDEQDYNAGVFIYDSERMRIYFDPDIRFYDHELHAWGAVPGVWYPVYDLNGENPVRTVVGWAERYSRDYRGIYGLIADKLEVHGIIKEE